MDTEWLARTFSLRGKVVLVTGGAGGIGRMLASACLRAGARVYVTGRKPDALERACIELGAEGDVRPIVGDLADSDGVRAIAAACMAAEPRLHVLINNAGQTWGAPLEGFPTAAWDPVLTVNVRSPFELVQRLLPALEAAGSAEDPARIINIGSVYATASEVMNAYSYTASKAAIHQLTRVLARELAPRHVLVNAIAPGLFPSKMTAFALRDEALRAKLLEGIPLRRPGLPEEIGGLAVFLASRAGGYLTGTVIPIDGGMLVNH
jgi:NAD(P)-dependent dehydrogenase (short-subunit alcohol dehydrogenase family)